MEVAVDCAEGRVGDWPIAGLTRREDATIGAVVEGERDALHVGRGVVACPRFLGGYDKGDDPKERRQQREIAEARRLLGQFKERQRRERRTKGRGRG